MKCSIIIPAYNARETIVSCLESALNQSIPRNDYEVILVDDGSTDSTLQTVHRHFADRIHCIRQDNQGPAAARNLGASHAKGGILVFTDSDCELDFHFVERIIRPFDDNDQIAGVQGSYKTRQHEFMARFIQIEIETRYSKMRKDRYTDFVGSYAAAYRKDVFIEHGGFDTSYPIASGEDADLSFRLSRNGHKMVFEPEAFVYHRHPVSLSHYLRVKFYRGFWRIRLYRKHPEKTIRDSYTPNSLKFQVLAVPLLVIFAVLALFDVFWCVPLAVLLGSFLVFSIRFCRLFAKRHYPGSVLIPVVLSLRAVALFLGMISGLIDSMKKKTH